MTDHNELRALALAATPGPWQAQQRNKQEAIYIVGPDCTPPACHAFYADNAAYIAAANPATVLALLDEVEAAHASRRAAQRLKRIYLSGPMTGLPEMNFPAFHAEAARLRALGFEVVNPADLNPEPNTGWHECMRNDLKALLDCDALALLDGWQQSASAHLEMHVAHRVGMEIVIAKEVAAS